jgi:hypothetical protein
LAAGVAWQRAHPPAPVPLVPRVLVVGAANALGRPGGDGYATISAAMAAARAGDTVEVPLGEYRDQVVLKSGVTLRSRVPREAVLRAPAVGGPAVLAEGVHAARLSGFSIEGSADSPLAAGARIADSEVEIDDTEVAGAEIGMEIRGGGHATLRANAIHDCLTGVLVSGPSRPWLSHNSFQRDKIALAARDGARPSLVGNFFEKTALELPADMDWKAIAEKNFGAPPSRPAAGRGPAAVRPPQKEREGPAPARPAGERP